MPAIRTGVSRAEMETQHPRGLYTLFFTEMWERFSYYGMRGLLVLFLVDKTRGGFGLRDEMAAAIYGLYTAAVYLAALPGGWIADRVLGAQRAVWIGGAIIAAGHFTIALDRREFFYVGLILIVAGTGLLKPNISAMVGQLYPEGGARRDAGFTIFYMGINLGAALGPIICGLLARYWRWQIGFGAAGVGMLFGLAQFYLTRRSLGEAGIRREPVRASHRAALFGGLGIVVLVIALCFAGVISATPVALAHAAKNSLVMIAALYFGAIFVFGRLDAVERKRVFLILILFVASAVFWAGFEQMGSSFNLFAERFTVRRVFGAEFPAPWFQSVGPVLIIALSPLIAAVWVWLGRKNMNPPIPAKFGLGLVFLALGFVLISAAAAFAAKFGMVGPWWLIGTYFLHTVGELCLSPVGLSSITKLAPQRFVGQMMGVWFLATSLGNLIAGLTAGSLKTGSPGELSAGFLQIAIVPALVGVLLMALAKPISRLSANVR
jgi:POT family proton-dependent oligopeptide transporter